MKKTTTLAIAFSTLITLASSANALELMVVKNYDGAADAQIWKKAKTDQVPQVLLASEQVASPASSYSQLFPKTFLQEPMFAVCFRNCGDKEIFKIKNDEMDERDRSNTDVIEQSNVYYWIGKYFNFIDNSLQYEFRHHLKIMTNRQIKDETKGKKMKNNAFFNPRDVTLSFLPATNNLLYKLMGGKINRSGFDPSVIAHEASHYFFHHLFPNSINDEISGLNEGFADYIANIFLNNPKVGLVMMHGKALRDSSAANTSDGKFKAYTPGLESHDMGERAAYALWESRKSAMDKTAFDRVVIDAVTDISENSYSTIHDFKMAMLERLPHVIEPAKLSLVEAMWELVFPGKPAKTENTLFLNSATPSAPALGFESVQELPESIAKEYGVPARTEEYVDIHQLTEITKTQFAIQVSSKETGSTPNWVVLDAKSGNVLGVYDGNKNLRNNPADAEKTLAIANTGKSIPSTIQDFKDKSALLTDFANGKGQFDLVYKRAKVTSTEELVRFNGTELSGRRIHIDVKRKLLTGILFGLPNIKNIELITVNGLGIKSLPELNGQTVVGYKMQFETGTSMQVILRKHAQ